MRSFKNYVVVFCWAITSLVQAQGEPPMFGTGLCPSGYEVSEKGFRCRKSDNDKSGDDVSYLASVALYRLDVDQHGEVIKQLIFVATQDDIKSSAFWSGVMSFSVKEVFAQAERASKILMKMRKKLSERLNSMSNSIVQGNIRYSEESLRKSFADIVNDISQWNMTVEGTRFKHTQIHIGQNMLEDLVALLKKNQTN